MRRQRIALLAVLALFAALPGIVLAQQASQLRGTWRINREQSDDINAKINTAVARMNVVNFSLRFSAVLSLGAGQSSGRRCRQRRRFDRGDNIVHKHIEPVGHDRRRNRRQKSVGKRHEGSGLRKNQFGAGFARRHGILK